MDLVEQLKTMGTIDTDGEEFLPSNMKHSNKGKKRDAKLSCRTLKTFVFN